LASLIAETPTSPSRQAAPSRQPRGAIAISSRPKHQDAAVAYPEPDQDKGKKLDRILRVEDRYDAEDKRAKTR
jgi:hypothetical protein